MLLILNLCVIFGILYIFFITLKKCYRLVKLYRKNKVFSPVDIASAAEDIAAVGKIAALVAGIAATLAAPAGLMALASAFGLVPRPLIIIALPAFIGFAAVSASISAGAKLYAKSAREKALKQPASNTNGGIIKQHDA